MERIKQNKWLLIMLSVVCFICTAFGLISMPQNTNTVRAESTSETWVLKETLDFSILDEILEESGFSQINYDAWYNYVNSGEEEYPYRSITVSASNFLVYELSTVYDSEDGWVAQNYRTVTFEEPIDLTSDFGKWLSSNATKQEAVLKISTVSVTLENNLTMNYKVAKEVLDVYSDVKIEFSFNDKVTPVTGIVDGDYLVFSFSNVEAKYIATNITATLKAKKGGETVTGETSDFDTYSIKQYCLDRLVETSNDLEKSLLVDLLNYGSACQLYNNYDTGNYANKDLNTKTYSSYKSYATSERDYDDSLNTDNAESSAKDIKIAGAEMLLENAINMKIYVYAKSTSGLTIEFYNGNTKIGDSVAVAGLTTIKNEGKNYYVVNFRGLNASELSDVITIKAVVNNEVKCYITYSVESYAYAKYNLAEQAEEAEGEVEDSGINLEQLVKAIMAYGDSAKAYVNKYDITTNLTNVSEDANNPTTINANATRTLVFTADKGYALPETVTVTGATYTYNKTTGELTISNPTGEVTITVIGEEKVVITAIYQGTTTKITYLPAFANGGLSAVMGTAKFCDKDGNELDTLNSATTMSELATEITKAGVANIYVKGTPSKAFYGTYDVSNWNTAFGDTTTSGIVSDFCETFKTTLTCNGLATTSVYTDDENWDASDSSSAPTLNGVSYQLFYIAYSQFLSSKCQYVYASNASNAYSAKYYYAASGMWANTQRMFNAYAVMLKYTFED